MENLDNITTTYKNQTGKGSKKCLPLAAGDTTPILDLVIDSGIRKTGRPAEYPNTPQGLDRFIQTTIDYFQFVRTRNADPDLETSQQIIPDVENWSCYLGISRMTLLTYEKRGGEWQETVQYYKNAIAAIKKNLALNYKVPPVLAIFDLCNNHNYINSSEYKLTTETQKEEKQALSVEYLPRLGETDNGSSIDDTPHKEV